MSYVDGFVIPVPKSKIAAYKKMAKLGAKIWREYGALDYYECVGDDLNIQGVTSFEKFAKLKSDETVIFAWIVYKSKAHRNQVNKKVMQDPRMQSCQEMPFSPKRMTVGGFKVLVKG
ncbi:MAG: DUF1428 domain-containing protein [Pseudomonadales bacterium]|jgi:uncharacterized protein YbaA (DUF1428 family)